MAEHSHSQGRKHESSLPVNEGAESLVSALKLLFFASSDEDADMEILPWIEEDNFNPGYLTRDIHKMPQRGAKPEWRHNQDYWREKDEIPATDLDGSEFIYDGKMRSASLAAPATQARSA